VIPSSPSHINSALNDGNLTELAVSLALFFLVRAIMRGYSLRNVAGILASTALAIWSKQTAYFLAIVVAGAFVWAMLDRYGRNRWEWIGVPLGVVVLGWLAWQVPSVHDILAALAQSGGALLNNSATSEKFWLFWRGGYHSLWATPGWQIGVDYHWWDKPALISVLVALIGVFWFMVRGNTDHESWSRQRVAVGWLGLALVLAVAELALINAYLLTLPAGMQGIHSRYAYVAALPFAILFAVGWRQLLPAAWRSAASLAFVTLFFLFDGVILLTYYIPFFYSFG
jgi:hypothetical protein